MRHVLASYLVHRDGRQGKRKEGGRRGNRRGSCTDETVSSTRKAAPPPNLAESELLFPDHQHIFVNARNYLTWEGNIPGATALI